MKKEFKTLFLLIAVLMLYYILADKLKLGCSNTAEGFDGCPIVAQDKKISKE